MKRFIVTGRVSKVDSRTSKAGSPYSIVRIEDTEGIVEVIVGSKVELPIEDSTVLCEGTIRSTPKEYQGGIFYSYSFSASKFETICVTEKVTEKVTEIIDVGDQQIPF